MVLTTMLRRAFDPEYKLLAKQWHKQRKGRKAEDEHFFAALDFVDGQPIYQRVRARHEQLSYANS